MKRAMRLRDKMTFLYTGLTLLAVLAFSALLYLSVQAILEQILVKNTQLALQQIIAQMEADDGALVFENEVPVSADTMYFITEANGSELASHGADITLFDALPMAPGAVRHVQGAGKTWALLDSDVIAVEGSSFRVRVATSAELNLRVLSTLRLGLLIGIPFMLLIAVVGGRLIAERSLMPIRDIIRSADRIAGGDLSARVPQTAARDELGELTATLNRMLQSVETSFIREKRFASDASHELRTPVAVMQAYAENLRAQPDATRQQKAELDTILAECRRMNKIITQLLTLTRGDEGRHPVLMETFDLREVAGGVADTLAERLSQRGMSLSIRMPEGTWLTADQSLMTELLLNLTENAVKYGRQGGHIDVAASRSGGDMVIRVADDGIGIPAEALPHIFERFYRVDDARDRSGTGLGLSIVDWIVNSHRGTVSVESEPHKGTVFQISLPAGAPEGAQASTAQAPRG